MKFMRPLLLAMGLAGSAALYLGCEIDSADEFIRNLPVDFSGYYTDDDRLVVDRNSGQPIRALDLRQTGDKLEAVDNNGMIWRGTIGDVNEGESSLSASFTLEGRNTLGREGIFSGTLSTDATSSTDTNGNTTTTASGNGIMRGSYIEDDIFSTFYGEAQDIPGVIPDPDDGGGDGTNDTEGVSISPSLTTISTNGATASFTASGGTGSYNFSLSNGSRGTITQVSGATATYQRTAAGDNTITAEDSDGDSASASILQP
jgi:hypothetical protein